MTEDLMPCPFCGGQDFHTKDDYPQAYIECLGCEMNFNRCFSDNDKHDSDGFKHIRDAWNRRAGRVFVIQAPQDGEGR